MIKQVIESETQVDKNQPSRIYSTKTNTIPPDRRPLSAPQAMSDWQDVVKATIFLKDIATHYKALNEVRCAYFKKAGLEVYPASTCVEAKLCRDELLVEMELIAIVRKDY